MAACKITTLLACVLLLSWTGVSVADPSLPVFSNFPSKETYAGKSKLPDFTGPDKKYREYRTRIRERLAEQGTPNFAGKYNLIEIGLTGGLVVAVVESSTGRIKWTDTIGGGPYHEHAFRKDSRLLIVQWSNGETCSVGYYDWTGSDFVEYQIAEAPVDSEGYCKNELDKSFR
jgi:hypothetical protein